MGLRQVTERLRHARRLLHLLVPAALVLGATLVACFDQSTYQGGGRRDIGGRLVPVDAGGEEEEEDAGEVPEQDSGGPVVPAPRDAGDAG